MQTSKGIIISRTKFKAVTTGLGSKIRIDKNNSLSFSFSFILNETLQLVEAPTIKPSVQSLPHIFVPTLSYSFKVLQYDCVSIADNFLAYFMINPTHITFLSPRDCFKLSLGRLCAFTLEFSPQVLVLHNLSLMTFENLAITTNSEIIYSDINTHNLVSTRIRGIDISGECDMKEQSSFSIFDNLKSLVSPIKIFPIIFRNIYRNIFPLSWYESSNPNFIKGKCKKISIESYRTTFYNRLSFKLSRLKISRSFTYCFNSKISSKIKLVTNILINQMMKFKSISYFSFKSFINSILNSFLKDIRHIKKMFVITFYFNCGDKFHNETNKHNSYINVMFKYLEMMNLT